MIFGKPDFERPVVHDQRRGVPLRRCSSTRCLTLVATGAAVFFFVVKPLNMLAARRKAGKEPEPEAVPEDVELLAEIRDLLRSQSSA